MPTLAESAETMLLYANYHAKHPSAPLGSVVLHAAHPLQHPSWLSMHHRAPAKLQPQTPSEICSVRALPQLYHCYFCPSSPHCEHKRLPKGSRAVLVAAAGSHRMPHRPAQVMPASILNPHLINGAKFET